VLNGTEAIAVTPSISATLENLKYCGNLDLPTQFYEAELDYFGKLVSEIQNCDLSEAVVDKYITFKLSATKG
jgi:6-phosphogluconate dehydrogenase